MKEQGLFAAERLTMPDAIELTVQSLQGYGPQHDHWAIAWSGGKDSTATLTLLIHLIESGRLAAPQSLTVYYADTRQELPPLYASSMAILEALRRRGNWIRTEVVRAPLDKRFLVYILGRGVPPPNNNTLRWCTRQIKVEPMQQAVVAELERIGASEGRPVLMITGVREGESAVRDRRIVMSCGKDGAECGQGWYQKVLPDAKGLRGRIATLAPLLHWRVCHVWDWLMFEAPALGWETRALADAYGGDEAEEINARTGCVGCPLASKDAALDTILRNPDWAYLAPLKGLKPLYRELREARHRLRKPGAELLKSGAMAANPQRLGPLTFAARLMALERILGMQAACNEAAAGHGWPQVDILNGEEVDRIRALISAGTWPDGWAGDEPTGDVPLDAVFADGSVQPLLM